MKSSGNGKRAPLRTLLQNFLNHVESMEAKKNQGDNQFDREFQELKLLSENLKSIDTFSCKEGEKEVNRKKNRYKDILPFDYTRVILSEFPGVPGSDYINANYIRGASGSNAYIASQGPLAHTVTDFWRMIVECEVQVIVMACNEEESGKHKCECYWVEKDGEPKKYGPYNVKLLKFRRHCSDFSLRTMELSYLNGDNETVTRTVVQFHYWAWPDHGVPNLVRPLLEMVRLIRDCQASETLPLLVHCSAGCGRTGTICAIDYVWGLLKTGKLSENFKLFDLVADMRRQRVAMVQTKDQYVLVHQAVKELFLDQLKMIDAHPYENLDMNGHPLISTSDEIRIDPSYETIFSDSTDDVLEVREEDDICLDASETVLPWPVLQLQAELQKESSSVQVQSGVPPLPDKKRKTNQAATHSMYDNVTSSSSSSKESTPPTSLDRTESKISGTDSSIERLETEVKSKSSSPSQNLVRRPSILKLRSLFERSGSEPRTEKRSKSTSRKASSFRFTEGPRINRAADSDPETTKAASQSSTDHKEFYKPPKLSIANPKISINDESPVRETEKKPSLPIKRSKSMKVYRNFDVHSAAIPKSKTEETITPAPFDIVLSKAPSITYVSSKEVLQSPTPISAQEPDLPILLSSLGHIDRLPLATSSLDRSKEQKQPKITSPVCGSLDRGSQSASSKPIPTYVNILVRNQKEASKASKLDDDTRQLLRDCQAYLMSSEGETPEVDKNTAEVISQLARNTQQRLAVVSERNSEKREKNDIQCERRGSFKQAVVTEPRSDAAAEVSSPNSSGSKPDDQIDSRTKKKTHEYEAVWLSPQSPVTEEINANSLVSKDSIFVQKSDEIRHLLNELRSSNTDQLKASPTLQPDRVLSELQDLVEQSDKLHAESLKSKTVPVSPSPARKPAYTNYPQPPPRDAGRVTSPLLGRKEPVPVSKPSSSAGTSKVQQPPKHSPTASLVTPTQAPAFRPPPPYPTNLVVRLPPPAPEAPAAAPKKGGPLSPLLPRRPLDSPDLSPKISRRPPPEYKAPPDPPVKRAVQTSHPVQPSPPPSSAAAAAPVAPPRAKKTVASSKSSPIGAHLPLGPPVPARSFASQQATTLAPGIDVDAVAAGMAAGPALLPPKNRLAPQNSSAAANRAFSKALGKFQATAASLKTKLAQLGGDEKTNSEPPSPVTPLPKMTRESSFVKTLGAYGGDVGVVNSSEATTYVRKKQQYL